MGCGGVGGVGCGVMGVGGIGSDKSGCRVVDENLLTDLQRL